MTFVVGQTVAFTFDTPGRSRGVRHRNYATGVIEKIGARLSVRVLDDPSQLPEWRKAHVGQIKVITPARVIPDLPD